MRVLFCLMALVAACSAWSRPAPLSIDALRKSQFANSMKFERSLPDGAGFTAYLVSYRCSQLKLFAYVAVPSSIAPAQGYPVLIANHGTHPNPPRYGFTADGVDARPGDYYRSIPELFTARGFMVVMPDYRGHNASEGLEYAKGFLASGYYTEDVLALIAALPSLERADTGSLFMWGHSLGGEVSLRALLATNKIKGASLWATVGGEIWDQAYHYSFVGAEDGFYDSSATEKAAVVQLRADIDALGTPHDWRSIEPLRFLAYLTAPLILHHATQDNGAAYQWSQRLAKELYVLGKRYEFYSYPGTDHFFAADIRRQVADHDARFFRSLMTSAP